MNKKGFTIIELVISIFVLGTAIVGVYSAFSIVSILTSDSIDKLEGTYLAQEGIEIIRNIRDQNWLYMDVCSAGGEEGCPRSWVDWLTSSGVGGRNMDCTGGCEVDYRTKGSLENADYDIQSYLGRFLCIDNSTGFYQYNSNCSTADKSKFKRKVFITPIEDVDGKNDHIIKVRVEVSWNVKVTLLNTSGSLSGTCQEGKNCVTAETTLYDWYNYVNH